MFVLGHRDTAAAVGYRDDPGVGEPVASAVGRVALADIQGEGEGQGHSPPEWPFADVAAAVAFPAECWDVVAAAAGRRTLAVGWGRVLGEDIVAGAVGDAAVVAAGRPRNRSWGLRQAAAAAADAGRPLWGRHWDRVAGSAVGAPCRTAAAVAAAAVAALMPPSAASKPPYGKRTWAPRFREARRRDTRRAPAEGSSRADRPPSG